MRDGHRGRRPGRSSESRCEVQPLRQRKTVVKTGLKGVRDVYFFHTTVRIFGVSIWVRPICRAAAQCQAGLTACPSFSTPVVVSIHPPTRALRSLRGRRRQLLQSYHRLSSTISRWSRRVAIYLLPVARTRKNCLLPTTGSNAHRVRWVAGHRRLVVVGLCIILHLCARAAQVGL